MGDTRFNRVYRRLQRAKNRPLEISALADEEVIAALAAASQQGDPYIANVLATEAQNRARRKRVVTDNMGEGVLAIDTAGCVTFANPAAARMLRRGVDALEGRDVRDALHSRVGDGARIAWDGFSLLEALLEGRTVRRSDDVFIRHDLTGFPVAYTASPIEDAGRVQGGVITFRDITDIRRTEERLANRERQHAALAAISQRALQEPNLDQLLSFAATRVAGALAVDLAAIWQACDDGALQLRAGDGWPPGTAGRAAVAPTPATPAGNVLTTGAPLLVENLTAERQYLGAELYHHHGIVGVAGAPIPGVAGPFGVLEAHTTNGQSFTRDDLDFLESVADVLAAAMERAPTRDWFTGAVEEPLPPAPPPRGPSPAHGSRSP